MNDEALIIAVDKKSQGFVFEQFSQIRKEGFIALVGKLYKFFLSVLLVPLVLLVRLLRPFVLVRFGKLDSSRIGHFASFPEIYLCEREAGINKKRTYDIFYCDELISNHQLKKMWKRILHISTFPSLAFLANRVNCCLPGCNKHIVPMEECKDLYGFYKHTPPHLSFTNEEERRGEQLVRKLGIAQDLPFVCFHARDGHYLKNVKKVYDWSYHDYRNSNVQSHIAAAEELARRGYFLVRMGAIVEKPLVTSNPMIIDYATKYRTDFLDIYLCAKCRFFIGSGAGIDEVLKIFRRPILSTNFIPLNRIEDLNSMRLFIPKKLWLRKERRFLAFREILDSKIGKFFYSWEYEEADIDIKDNTSAEIREAAIEMDERLKGTWQTSEDDELLQRRFWSLFKPSQLRTEISTRIGTEFLRQNRQLLA